MVEVDAPRRADRVRYCKADAQLVLVATKGAKRLRRLERCAGCRGWAARDLELRRGGHARPLCGRCAEAVDELVAALGEAVRP